MGNTSIQWTDSSWNPVRGCVKVSPGCKHCYAETFAERWRGIPGHPYEQGFDLRLLPEKIAEPLHWKKPRRIFVNSMSDLFQDGVPFEFIDKAFAVMALCPQHTFQCLTKRPERMLEYVTTRRSDIAALVYNSRYEQGINFPVDGGSGRTRNRPARTNLEDSETRRKTGSRIVRDETMRESQSGVSATGRVSADCDNQGRSEDGDGCASGGLELFQQKGNSARGYDQPQRRKRGQSGQQAVEFGTGNIQRTAETRTGSTEGEASSSNRIDSSKNSSHGNRCLADQKTTGVRRDGDRHCVSVQDEASGSICNLSPDELETYLTWPLPNVWLGVSVENQQYADERIPLLLQTPAAVRFVSYEPALGPVDFERYLGVYEVTQDGIVVCSAMQGMRRSTALNKVENEARLGYRMEIRKSATVPSLDWLIVGGESGPGARSFDVQWARDSVRQCKAAAVSCFVKQVGSLPIIASARQNHWDWFESRGEKSQFENYSENPAMWKIRLKSSKGGDVTEWPEDLQVREFPRQREP